MRLLPCLLLNLLVAAPAATADVVPQAIKVNLARQTTGTFYIHGQIRGFGALDLLVDTGSSHLVINKTMLDSLKSSGTAEFSHNLEGLMANGSRHVIEVYRLGAIQVGDSCWLQDVDAAVFPNASRAILGMNVLTRLAPFTFSVEPPSLTVSQCLAAQERVAEPLAAASGSTVQASARPPATAP